MKLFLIITLSILTLILLGYFLFVYITSPSYLAKVIRDNPSNFSIILCKNDSFLIHKNTEAKMPLASTLKTIIAIVYAEQVAAEKLQSNELIAISELEKYHIVNTDGGAHTKWLKELSELNKVNDNKVELFDVVNGMIKFSSNANAEFLIEKLGIENINNRIKSLGLIHHEKINYIVSSLFIENIDSLNAEEMLIESQKIHQRLHDLQLDKIAILSRNEVAQKKWSDRLPAATATEYYTIMNRINSGNYFSKKVQIEIDKTFNFQPKQNAEKFKKIGGKGGSTKWILNVAYYATTIENDKIELILFSNANFDNDYFPLLKSGFGELVKALMLNNLKSKSLIETINSSPIL